MNDENWGLTEKGFNRPTYTTLLNALEYKARELFGDGINLTVRSPLGLFLRILAWMWNILFSCLEDVYNSRFVDTAVGNSLYNLGKNIGMQLLAEGKATGYIKIAGDEGTKVPAGFLVATNSGLQYTTMAAAVIPESGTVTVLVQAADIGPEYNTGVGTVQMIVNPASVPGIVSVTNESDITGGRWKETDAEFRERYFESVDYSGGVNADAIRAAILNDIAGVSSAYVYENDTDNFDDEYQLPPHSIEAVVYGGIDEEIAQCIYKRRAGGIQTVGSETVNVITASGQVMGIRFSRPVPKKIYIRIFNLVKSAAYPGNRAIKEALVTYIGDSKNGGSGIGESVIYVKILGVLAAIPGVEDFDVEIGTDGTAYGRSNIEMGYREKAVTEESAVTIT